MNYRVDEEVYDLIERNYDAWELDEQFDRQPLWLPKRIQRIDIVAAAYFYGRETKEQTVALTTKSLHACFLWSDYLNRPIIMELRRV